MDSNEKRLNIWFIRCYDCKGSHKDRVHKGTSEREKDFGVLMDSELKFLKHVEEHVNKATESLVSLGDLISISIGKAWICCLLLLCAHTWSLEMLFGLHASKKTDCWSRVSKDVQRCATTLVPGLKELDFSERLKSMDIYIYILLVLLFIYIYYIHGLYIVTKSVENRHWNNNKRTQI